MPEDTLSVPSQGIAEAVSLATWTLANQFTADTGQEYPSVFDWLPWPDLEAQITPEGLPFYTSDDLQSCLDSCKFTDNFLHDHNPIVSSRALEWVVFSQLRDSQSQAMQSFMQDIPEVWEDQSNGATALAALTKASFDALAVCRATLEDALRGSVSEADVLASIAAAQEQLREVKTAFRQIENMLHQTNGMFLLSQTGYDESFVRNLPMAAPLDKARRVD